MPREAGLMGSIRFILDMFVLKRLLAIQVEIQGKQLDTQAWSSGKELGWR